MRPGQGAAGARMLALIGAALATLPAEADIRAVEPVPAAYHIGPPAPDCGAMAARHGPQRLWFGAISGNRFDTFWDTNYPYYAQGCFLSERTCRRWLHENLSFMQGGSLNWMRCEPGVPPRALY